MNWIRSQADEWAAHDGCYFDEEAADRVVRFFRKFLVHSKGQFAGKPFELLDWQYTDLIAPIFGWKRADGTRRYRRCYVEIPKKNGKDLDLTTPIPTPNGWATIESLEVGDKVYDEDGMECDVTAKSDIGMSECYILTFADGSHIVASETHEWVTKARSNKKFWKNRTTKEIYQSQRYRDGSAGHCVWIHGVIEGKTKYLPISPYHLGFYLGNGTTCANDVTINNDDLMEVVSLLGGNSNNVRNNGDGNSSRVYFEGFAEKVKDLLGEHTYDEKYIPIEYLRANRGQRWQLLQGLMDSDGCAGDKGQCIYVTASESLRDSVIELLNSLGFKVTYNYVDDTQRKDRNCKGHWRVLFTAYRHQRVFGVERKQSKLPLKQGKTRSDTLAIVSVEEIGPRPTQCIEVNSPNKCYLAGRGFTPTHNSTLGAGLALYLLCGDNEPGAEVYSAAADRGQAKIVYKEARRMVEASPILRKALYVIPYKNSIEYHEKQAEYCAVSSDVPTKEGLNIHGLIFDELHTQPNKELWDALRYGGAARRQPLLFAITTAGKDVYSMCYEQHVYAQKILTAENNFRDDEYFAYIRAADPDDDIESEEVWRKANPSLGQTISVSGMRSDINTAKQNPSELNAFKRYRLNMWCGEDSKWVDWDKWQACIHADTPLPEKGSKVIVGIDLSSINDICAAVAYFPESHITLPKFWCLSDTIKRRTISKLTRYDVWVDAGYLVEVDTAAMDYDLITAYLAQLSADYDVIALVIDPWNATKYAVELQEKHGYHVEFCRQGTESLSAPMKELERLYTSGQLVHYGNPV